MRWYHLCFSYDYRDSSYRMVMDGETLSEGVHTKDLHQLKGDHLEFIPQLFVHVFLRWKGAVNCTKASVVNHVMVVLCIIIMYIITTSYILYYKHPQKTY